jgi:hypothetical protein
MRLHEKWQKYMYVDNLKNLTPIETEFIFFINDIETQENSNGAKHNVVSGHFGG